MLVFLPGNCGQATLQYFDPVAAPVKSMRRGGRIEIIAFHPQTLHTN